MMLVLVDLFVVIFGLCFGSFLNVLIYRLPLSLSIIFPRSFCPSCKSPLRWYHNIPLVSYMVLKGSCAFCKCKISYTYVIVEIITAVVTWVLFKMVGFSLSLLPLLFLFYLLIVLSFIDFNYKAVPDYLLLLLFILPFFIVEDKLESFQQGLLFVGGFFVLDFILTFYIQNIKSRLTNNEQLKHQKALGEGDFPVIFLIGMVLGIKGVFMAFFIGALLALFPSVYNMVFKKEIETPFIPYLSLGFFIVYSMEFMV